MAWTRRLDSGLWAATVRTPAGRITKTDKSKGVVDRWAVDQESDIQRGDWIDPRAADITLAAWRNKVKDARRREKASKARDESHWRCHVEPRWGRSKLSGISHASVCAWVGEMERAGVGAATIEGAVGALRGLMRAAVANRLLRTNPAIDVPVPRRPAHVDRVLAPEEDVRLLDALDRLFPERTDGSLFVELMLYCGLRWEEAAALNRGLVNTRRKLINVGPVMERDGTIRPYPKSPAGERSVPVDEKVWPRLHTRVQAAPAAGLIVTSPEGKGLDYSRWLSRVWKVALHGKPAYAGARGHPARQAIEGAALDDPQPTPHDLRHTYGTRLGEHGVPVHEIMALMGHESLASAQRYLHARDERFDRAREAMKASRKVTRVQGHESP